MKNREINKKYRTERIRHKKLDMFCIFYFRSFIFFAFFFLRHFFRLFDWNICVRKKVHACSCMHSLGTHIPFNGLTAMKCAHQYGNDESEMVFICCKYWFGVLLCASISSPDRESLKIVYPMAFENVICLRKLMRKHIETQFQKRKKKKKKTKIQHPKAGKKIE